MTLPNGKEMFTYTVLYIDGEPYVKFTSRPEYPGYTFTLSKSQLESRIKTLKALNMVCVLEQTALAELSNLSPSKP